MSEDYLEDKNLVDRSAVNPGRIWAHSWPLTRLGRANASIYEISALALIKIPSAIPTPRRFSCLWC
jgi:hypothetical protein